MKNLAFAISFILLSLCCFAQYSITGRVISQADTKTVAIAGVFLSNATIGSHTAADGTFTLRDVKPGKYDLVISVVGFDTYLQPVTVTNNNIDLQTITIFTKSITLGEVKIKATKGPDPDRARYMTQFTGEFLGTTDVAKECRILNPELIDFDYDSANNILKASSVDFLVIQNDALGYKIKYLLKDFTLDYAEDGTHTFSYSGSVFFEAMQGSPAQQRNWQQRRQEVYEGSQTHFFQSLINGTIDKDGFRVLRVPANPLRPADSVVQEKIRMFAALKNDKLFGDSLKYWTKKAGLPRISDKINLAPLKKEDIIIGPDKQGLYSLLFNNDALFISYNKYHHFNRSAPSKVSDPENKDNTLVTFNHERLLFDKNGSFINPDGLSFDGVWMRGRLATLLPVDYEPQQITGMEIDSEVVKKVTAKMNAYLSTHVTEKVYLHFDKPYYAAGDTIYYKAYLTQGEDHKLNHLSGVLYVDLVDPLNKIIKSEKVLVTDGVGWGDFSLSSALLKGSYRIRAYTQWMRNAGDNAFFDKTIQVGSTAAPRIPESGTPANKSSRLKPDLKFFPESGNLVTGVKNKIAFKAIASSGLGVDVKGIVVDNENKQVATFTSAHLGMGYFYITPSETKTYTARVTYSDGTTDEIEIPKGNSNEIKIAFTDNNRLWSVRINSGKQWYQQNKGKMYTLIIYSGGAPQSYSVKLESQDISLDVSKKDLHAGIATATLFSAIGEPLCERLLFVQNCELLNLDVNADKSTYTARANTTIKLNVSKATGEPASGHFSVAVIDESKVLVDDNSESTIINDLLLTSDLKGFVEQPNYYFTNSNEKTAADLDLVMLTHGYRKYEWEQILNNDDNQVMAYKPEIGLTVSGIVKFNGKPVDKGRVKLFGKASGGLMLDTVTDQNGRFIFNKLAYYDTTKFVVQASTAKDQKEVDVKPDSLTAEAVVTSKDTPGPDAGNSLAIYEHNSKQFFDEQRKYGINKNEVQLQEVIIKDKKINPFVHSQNLNGAGNADQTVTAEWLENSGYTSLYDALRAKLTFVTFTKTHKLRANRTVLTNTETADYLTAIVDGSPQLMLDDPKNNMERGVLDYYDANDIESVEVLIGPHYGAIYGNIASGGAIIVTTKQGRRANNYYKEAPGVITVKPGGFYKARQFYAPKYDHPETIDPKKDLRTTIYWKPEITTDMDGNATFNYYNADGTGNYRVVIEGIDTEGNLGRQVYYYKVE
ncbi:MAG: carboxypeptidase-like regulatory domain-containing protein [Bacteroidota bacterium]|nr:carboxypeptidase-like regulatory domain-containing protein [Bacteroidota bacterium]